MLKINKYLSHYIEKYSIFLILILVFAFMALFAPNFLNLFNLTNVLKGMSLNALVAIGFTIVMISGHLDLSIGSNLTLGAMFVIGFQPQYGWFVSLLIAIVAGSIVGFANGLLVAKAKIDSFIVTLGTMTIVQGIIFMYSKGSALNVTDFSLADWIDNPVIPLFPPRVIITIILVIVFEVFLRKTSTGKGFYMVGGNKETAWLAGLKTDMYIISAFTISGFTAALGGALFAISISSAVPTIGASSLMIVIAATIIGGTSMAGGKGGVVRSMVAVLTLVTLYNGLNCFGAGYEVQIFASGLVLAFVVLYEAYSLYKRQEIMGRRTELLKELNLMK